MTLRRLWRPSASFIAVCLCNALVLMFFAWGFSRPALDRVWTLTQELKTGGVQTLKPRQRRLLRETLDLHPMLASALLDGASIGIISSHQGGWIDTPTVTIIRTPKATSRRMIAIDVQMPRDLLPLKIAVRGDGWSKRLTAKQQGLQKVALPAARDRAELIEVQLKGRHLSADPSVLGTHVSFPVGRARQ